jgi:hypothetical protein
MQPLAVTRRFFYSLQLTGKVIRKAKGWRPAWQGKRFLLDESGDAAASNGSCCAALGYSP